MVVCTLLRGDLVTEDVDAGESGAELHQYHKQGISACMTASRAALLRVLHDSSSSSSRLWKGVFVRTPSAGAWFSGKIAGRRVASDSVCFEIKNIFLDPYYRLD